MIDLGHGRGCGRRSFDGIEVGQIMTLRRCCAWALLPALVQSFAARALGQPQVTFSRLAFTAQEAPGLPGTSFNQIGFPRMDTAGQTAFTAVTFGPGDFRQSVWVGRPGAIQVVAREDDPAPGVTSGVTFGPTFFDLAVNQQQQAAFLARLIGPGIDTTNDLGLWAGVPGGLHQVAREGGPAAGLPDVRYEQVQDLVTMRQTGQLIFGARLVGAGVTADNDTAFFYGPPTAPGVLLREGDAAPGTTGVFSGIFMTPANRSGALSFRGELRGAVTSDDDSGLWYGTPSAFQLLIREGAPAPGTGPGVRFALIQGTTYPLINDNGNVSFRADLEGAGVNNTNRTGIWFGKPGDLRLLVRQGQPAPGTGAEFGRSNTFDTENNDRDEVLFTHLLQGSGVTTTNDESIWLARGPDLRLVAREGDVAPDTNGAWFGTLIDAFPALSNTGQLAFRARLTGPGVDETNDQGLWATDPAGVLHLVAREGMSIELLPGFVRNVTAIGTSGIGWEGGLDPVWSDAGELAFQLQLGSSASGAFVTVIPEPACGAAVAVFARLLARRPRKAWAHG